jgi:hypothetical protein
MKEDTNINKHWILKCQQAFKIAKFPLDYAVFFLTHLSQWMYLQQTASMFLWQNTEIYSISFAKN